MSSDTSAFTSSDPSSVFPVKAGETSVPSYLKNPSNNPVETNNFFANLLLGSHDQPVWTNPYKLTFHSNACNAYFPQRKDLVYGPDPIKYFYYPNGINDIILTSQDFTNATPNFTLSNADKFSITANYELNTSSISNGKLSFPLVQGMGFVTGIYTNLIPLIQSIKGFSDVKGVACQNPKLKKFIITLGDGSKWTLFLNQDISIKFSLSQILFNKITTDPLVLQVGFDTFEYYDQVAGNYVDSVDLTMNDSSYQMSYNLVGTDTSLLDKTLIMAPPHWKQTFTDFLNGTKANFIVNSCTLGTLQGCITDKLIMDVSSSMPTKYTGGFPNQLNLSSDVKSTLLKQARLDGANDIESETNLDSMYFSGKVFMKYAYLLYIVHYVLKDADLASTIFNKLVKSYNRFIENNQQYPLLYDLNFKGIVSSATGGDDFGNGHYNDHHFHYGYHIHAIGLMLPIDKEINGGKFYTQVKDWIELLIQDVFTLEMNNKNFPFMRNFDFYNGHSWAKGLYESGDGKDEESSSEDYNCYYGIKLYGQATDNSELVNKSSLVLATLVKSLNNYFYYADDNQIEPNKFIYNKVSGIYFENKIDHTTYFGNYESYIHGIHMIPVTAIYPLYKSKLFIQSEWDLVFKDGTNMPDNNWRSILMLNYSLVDPELAFNFFNDNFDFKYIDDGLTLTYCLFVCACKL